MRVHALVVGFLLTGLSARADDWPGPVSPPAGRPELRLKKVAEVELKRLRREESGKARDLRAAYKSRRKVLLDSAPWMELDSEVRRKVLRRLRDEYKLARASLRREYKTRRQILLTDPEWAAEIPVEPVDLRAFDAKYTMEKTAIDEDFGFRRLALLKAFESQSLTAHERGLELAAFDEQFRLAQQKLHEEFWQIRADMIREGRPMDSAAVDWTGVEVSAQP